MISNILAYDLGLGALPLFDLPVEVADHFYSLDPGRLNAEGVFEGAYWQSHGNMRQRCLINLDTEATYDAVAGLMGYAVGIIHDQNPDVPGTLIVAVRSRFYIEDVLHLCMGVGFVPTTQGFGFVLEEGDDPLEMVKDFLQGNDLPERQQATPPDEPTQLFQYYTDGGLLVQDFPIEKAWEVHELTKAWQVEWAFHLFDRIRTGDGPAQKAKLLLYNHLTLEQIASLEEDGYFDVLGGDGLEYRIKESSHMNIYLLVDGAPAAMFCLVSTSSIPTSDLLLAQKFMLESCPEEVWKTANRWIYEGTDLVFVYSPRVNVPRLQGAA